MHSIIYSVLAIACLFYTQNGCSYSPIAPAVSSTKLFSYSAITESPIGVGGLRGGWDWAEAMFFSCLAKREQSSPIALVVRDFFPKFYYLIKYSRSCNLKTETFVQNPMRTFLPCVPKFKSDFLCGRGMLRKGIKLFGIGWSKLRPWDKW